MRGSHLGNVSDLQEALKSKIPFFTQDEFSYKINSPYQNVSHHLARIKTKLFLKKDQQLEFNVSSQFNQRFEYDIRRGGRSSVPSLSLSQWTFSEEAKYIKNYSSQWVLKTGIQHQFKNNFNQPETGIFPLIPNYTSHDLAVYQTNSKKITKGLFDIGLRVERNFQNVIYRDRIKTDSIIHQKKVFYTSAFASGFSKQLSSFSTIGVNSSFGVRSPAVNELFSNGLHQGVSGLEEGTSFLVPEKGWKTNFSFSYRQKQNLLIETSTYAHWFRDFIYLKPEQELRLTIRGAFPVFSYSQTDALIGGADLTITYDIKEQWYFQAQANFIIGQDLKNKLALINIPASNVRGSFYYRSKKTISLAHLHLENFEFGFEPIYVFTQNRLKPEQDFLPAPPGYFLLSQKMSVDIPGTKLRWRFVLSTYNLFNQSYRDYLNRWRYFADDTGINISFGLQLKF